MNAFTRTATRLPSRLPLTRSVPKPVEIVQAALAAEPERPDDAALATALLCKATAAWFLEAMIGDAPAAMKIWKQRGVEMWPVVRANTTGAGSAGGFLVPQQMADTIIALRNVAGVFVARLRCGQWVPMRCRSRVAVDLAP